MNVNVTQKMALLFALALFIGCNSKTSEPAAKAPGANVGHAAHDHPAAGPHGGDIVELGNEEYHAELTHEGETVVYLLDGTAKAAAPFDAAEVTINVSHDGKGEQFKLAASRDANDPEGKSSRFTSSDAELLKDLEEGHAEVTLVISIEGTQYRGSLEHAHEHGHEHGEDGHEH